MTQEITETLRSLDKRLSKLESAHLKIDMVQQFESLPDNATVGKDYVAYRFNCSVTIVRNRGGGTSLIPTVKQKPLTFIKRDVDRVHRELSKPIKQRVAEIIAASPKRKR